MKSAAFLLLLLIAVPYSDSQTVPNTVSTQDARVARPGSKDDIDSIGARQIGKRGVGNWYSPEREVAVGKEYAEEIESEVTLLQNRAVTAYIDTIAQRIARHSDAHLPLTVKVIDSDDPNAFSLMGGYLYVNSGMLLACDEEAELAGVIAHEIAHISAHHAARQMTRSNIFDLATLPLTMVGGGAAIGAARLAANVVGPLAFMKFSRGFESEADYLGLEYLYAAGYDPDAYVSFLERIGSHEAKTGRFKTLFATHPRTSDRVKKMQQEIERVLRSRPEYVLTTSEFDDVKRELLSAEERRQAGATTAPTLRKRTLPAPQEP